MQLFKEIFVRAAVGITHSTRMTDTHTDNPRCASAPRVKQRYVTWHRYLITKGSMQNIKNKKNKAITYYRNSKCWLYVCISPFKFAEYVSENGAIVDDLWLVAALLKQSESVVLSAHFQTQCQRLNNLILYWQWNLWMRDIFSAFFQRILGWY